MPGFLPGTLRASANPLPADLSRLEQISTILDISLTDLIGLEDRAIYNFASLRDQNNFGNNFGTHIHSAAESTELAHDLSKSQMENDYLKEIIAQKDKEIACLRELLDVLKNPPAREGE